MNIERNHDSLIAIREWLFNKTKEDDDMVINQYFKMQMSYFNDIVALLIYDFYREKTLSLSLVLKAISSSLHGIDWTERVESMRDIDAITHQIDVLIKKIDVDLNATPFDEENRVEATPPGEGDKL